MSITRMDHVGIVVDDLAAAIAFFRALGMELTAEWTAEGAWVGRVIGLEDVRSRVAMLQTPDGHGKVELSSFDSPPSPAGPGGEPSNTPGIRHLTFAVDDLHATLDRLREHGVELVGTIERYEDVFELCYVRGPQGIIVELAQQLG
jgi:catechol 2,3-dioxygenase-like lactoylglutathione lyase family enzyme